jgi:RHS repeat-associated protein
VLVLANKGTVTETGIAISATGDFTQVNDCKDALAPQASCRITVRYYPAAAGARSGALNVTSEGGKLRQSVLRGVAYLAAVPSLAQQGGSALSSSSWSGLPEPFVFPGLETLGFTWKPRGDSIACAQGKCNKPGSSPCGTQLAQGTPAVGTSNPGNNSSPAGSAKTCVAPIDLASGVDSIQHTDIALTSNRGSIRLVRTMRTGVVLGGFSSFGVGGQSNFDLMLDSDLVGSVATFNVLMPDGRVIPFVRQQDGTLTNAVNSAWQGAVITTTPDNTAALRLKDGTVYNFFAIADPAICLLSSISDPNGNTITLTRNPGNIKQFTAITDPVGRQLILTWDPSLDGPITSITDPLGRTLTYTYSNGYLTNFTDANGGVWQYGYDNLGNLISVTDPRPVVVEQNTFDGNGRVISQIEADGSSASMSYTLTNPTDGMSPVESATETDQLGNVWAYTFNQQGYTTLVTDPTGNSRTFTRSPANELLAMAGPGTCDGVCGDPTQGDLTFTYDGNGNLLTRTDSLNNTYAYTYDPVYSHVLTAQDPVGNTAQYQYDSFGNLVEYMDPRGDITTIQIGVNGLPVSTTDPMGDTTTFEFDNFGNLVSVTDALGEITTFNYDPVSRLVQMTDPTGARNSWAWDRLDRLTSQTNANGGVTSYTYDKVNNLLTLTDPRGGLSQYFYDNLSRVVQHIDPLQRSETFGYDPLSNLIQHIDRRGQTSTFGYDPIYRLTTETYVDANVTRTYDAYSHPTQVVDTQGGTFGFTWDTAGRLLQSAAPAGSVTYVRDSDGRPTSRQVSGQTAVSYQYDQASNLTQALLGAAYVNMTYDSRNSLSTVARSNGLSSAYAYDQLDRVLSIAHQAGNNVLSSFSYTYDSAGNRSGATSSPAQALITKAATGVFDASNEVNTFRGQTYTYDNNGNRLTQVANGEATSYAWDGRNRLESITLPSGTVTTFTYDFNRNLTQTVTGSAATSYVLDDWTNVAAIYGGAAGTLSLLTGQSIDSHYATVNSSGQAQFALPDALNSVVANSGASATLSGTNLYEPFGQTTSTGTSFPFAFTGRVPVAGGAYYYRNRYYDPAVGRFLSEDPIGLAGGDNNFYRYAGNSPLGHDDPYGLWLFEPLVPLPGWAQPLIPLLPNPLEPFLPPLQPGVPEPLRPEWPSPFDPLVPEPGAPWSGVPGWIKYPADAFWTGDWVPGLPRIGGLCDLFLAPAIILSQVAAAAGRAGDGVQ